MPLIAEGKNTSGPGAYTRSDAARQRKPIVAGTKGPDAALACVGAVARACYLMSTPISSASLPTAEAMSTVAQSLSAKVEFIAATMA